MIYEVEADLREVHHFENREGTKCTFTPDRSPKYYQVNTDKNVFKELADFITQLNIGDNVKICRRS